MIQSNQKVFQKGDNKMRELSGKETKNISGGWTCCVWSKSYLGSAIVHINCGRIDPYYKFQAPRVAPYGYRRIG